jgi:hypothetical protein
MYDFGRVSYPVDSITGKTAQQRLGEGEEHVPSFINRSRGADPGRAWMSAIYFFCPLLPQQK